MPESSSVVLKIGQISLDGILTLPEKTKGIVLFAHGTGSSRFSPRNQYVAKVLNKAGIGTLLMDLLIAEEEKEDLYTGHIRFNIELLAERLIGATDWLTEHARTKNLKIGYFGASTGAGGALLAAPKRRTRVHAIVSRGGRPDLAAQALPHVQIPTLLIVGGLDTPVIELNQAALKLIAAKEKKLEIIPGATHLFEEPGTLEKVAELTAEWFGRYLNE